MSRQKMLFPAIGVTLLVFLTTGCGLLEAAATPTPGGPPVPSATASPAATVPPPTSTPGPVEPTVAADVVFHGGAVLTMDPGRSQAQAIAVLGDRILAVGADHEILALQGPETQVIDLAGQPILPGLIDGHTHVLASHDEMGRSLDEAQDLALSYGFTSLTEMWADEAFLEELLQAEEEGRLRLRVNAFPIYNQGFLDEDGHKVIVRAWYPARGPITASDRMLRIPGIKVFVDGGAPGRGCPAVRDPYPPAAVAEESFREHCGSDRGDLYWSQEELDQVVADAQAAGYRVSFHAVADGAIEAVLNAIAFALDGQPNALYRHQIQHNSLAGPDQLDRYVELDVLGSVRGYFNTCEQDIYAEFYGPDRYQWVANRYALSGLGVHAYLETDYAWTVPPTDVFAIRTGHPMVHLFGLVTRQQVQQDGTVCTPQPWLARPAISVEQALRMMTFEPAYAVSQEDVLGTLEPGKFADLVIFSANPTTVDPNDLKDLEVWMTMVGGEVEFCAAGHEDLCPLPAPSGPTPEAPAPAPSPTPTQIPEPPVEPTEGTGEPLAVRIASREERVPANRPIVLEIGWLCDTPEQVTDFVAAMSFTVSLDGELLPDVADHWGEVEGSRDVDEDGDTDHVSRWRYPIGVLTPGTHLVETRGTLQWTVTDGFDSDGDGALDEFSGPVWEFSLRLVVEE